MPLVIPLRFLTMNLRFSLSHLFLAFPESPSELPSEHLIPAIAFNAELALRRGGPCGDAGMPARAIGQGAAQGNFPHTLEGQLIDKHL